MLESYKWMGWVGLGWESLKALILRAPLCGAISGRDWDGMGWKSLKALILRTPLCGANNKGYSFDKSINCYVHANLQ